MNLSDLCWFCRTGSGGGSGGSGASGLRRGSVTPGAASALGERSSIPVDGEQYLCVCCMCSELKRILPSPHIPETPQQRFVLYFSLKFGCKAVTRGEERFNLVLGPQKPYGCSHIFLLSLLTRAVSVSRWPGWRGLAGAGGGAVGWLVEAEQSRAGQSVRLSRRRSADSGQADRMHHRLFVLFLASSPDLANQGSAVEKAFLCVCLSCPESRLSRGRS